MASKAPRRQPGLIARLLRASVAVCMSIGPGKTLFTVRQCINLHKLLVIPIYLAMIFLYRDVNKTPTAYSRPKLPPSSIFSYATETVQSDWWEIPAVVVLFVCHGLYGILWVLKDIFFPDIAWQAPLSPLGGLILFVWPLGIYYVDMFCLVSNECPASLRFAKGDEPWVLGGGLGLFILGMFYHYCADLQKYIQLKYQRPRSLIMDGLFRHSRNPNYFGEILIYLGFAVLSCNFIVFPLFAVVWLLIFVPNMLAKEASMSVYKEWDEWVSRSGFVVPYIPAVVADMCGHSLTKLPCITQDRSSTTISPLHGIYPALLASTFGIACITRQLPLLLDLVFDPIFMLFGFKAGTLDNLLTTQGAQDAGLLAGLPITALGLYHFLLRNDLKHMQMSVTGRLMVGGIGFPFGILYYGFPTSMLVVSVLEVVPAILTGYALLHVKLPTAPTQSINAIHAMFPAMFYGSYGLAGVFGLLPQLNTLFGAFFELAGFDSHALDFIMVPKDAQYASVLMGLVISAVGYASIHLASHPPFVKASVVGRLLFGGGGLSYQIINHHLPPACWVLVAMDVVLSLISAIALYRLPAAPQPKKNN
eukprot:m.258887 g.258887  ORF g.258887 m.258887 type:complete len:589 (-) comp37236_c0_seq1:84-1850(-)